MSLEGFRRSRMVVLTGDSLAYQAARAMADNHVGAVLVSHPPGLVGILTDRDLALSVLGDHSDPKATTVGEIMSDGVITCDIGETIDTVVRIMRDHAVRRVPVTENGRPVGLVTFDDLVLDGSVSPEALRAIVTAQLELEAPQKPAGALHPARAAQPSIRARALLRAQARAEATYSRMLKAVSETVDLEEHHAERALLIVLSMLCRRLTPQEARHLIAQLPSKLHRSLERSLDGPDRAVTSSAMEDELGRALGLDRGRANAVARGVLRVISATVAAGQIDEVKAQLPSEMRALFN